MQLEALDWVEPSSSVESDRDLVACSDNDMGGVLLASAHFREKSLHQKRSDSAPLRNRVDGNGEELCTLAGTSGAVAKSLADPAPRSEQPPAAGERDS